MEVEACEECIRTYFSAQNKVHCVLSDLFII